MERRRYFSEGSPYESEVRVPILYPYIQLVLSGDQDTSRVTAGQKASVVLYIRTPNSGPMTSISVYTKSRDKVLGRATCSQPTRDHNEGQSEVLLVDEIAQLPIIYPGI